MKQKSNVRNMTQLALLTALLLVMAYTPLGYLPVGPLTLSLLTIPVAIGAMLLGPAAGAFLGGVFGLTSFWNMVQGTSAMGAAIFAVSPLGAFVVAVVARILMGLCCGLVYKVVAAALASKGGWQDKLCCAIGGLAAPVLNTVFFMGSLVLFFYGTDYVQGLCAKLGATNPLMFIILLVGVQGLVETVVCCLVSTAVTVPLKKVLKK